MPEKKKSVSNENYELYDRLDRLEELLEDMDELGIESREQVETEIAAINQRLDQDEGAC